MSDDNTKKKKDDPEFDQYIRELKPNWFDEKSQNKKDQLIELAKNGYQRPSRNPRSHGTTDNFYSEGRN